MKSLTRLFLSAAVLAACTADAPLGLDVEAASRARAAENAKVSVLTWNIYVGAPLQSLLLVTDPNQIPFEVANLMGQVVATDFYSRAEAIADQIEMLQPDVVSLQEVSQFRAQSPGDFLVGNPVQATTPLVPPGETLPLDWRVILDDALARRGLSYQIASQTMNLDIELPVVNFSTGMLDDVRLTDYDVILVRDGVPWSNPAGGNFREALPLELGPITIPKPSGWASVDVEVGKQTYRFVNTHPEPADIAPGVLDPGLAWLHGEQVKELVEIMDASPYPVVLTGDLNTAADGSTTSTYSDLLTDGFVDAWLHGKPKGDGHTSNQAPDLLNPTSQMFHRIDYILFRNRVTRTSGHLTGNAKSQVVGAEQADRTPDGLWPSDHAGVFTALSLAPGNGIR